MRTLHVNVINKVATYTQRDGVIVCGNSDYQIAFAFDSEWDSYSTKTARFVWNGGYIDQVFSGSVCHAPIIKNTTSVSIGVYAGELCTTTPAVVECVPSILCGAPVVHPEQDVVDVSEAKEAAETAVGAAKDARDYADLAKRYAEEAEAGGGGSGSQTYVVDTFEKFLAQIELGVSLAYQSFDNTTLNTGDQVIIKSGGVPCFWFEKDGAVDEYEQDGTSHNLAVYDSEGGVYLGTFHPILGANEESVDQGSRTYVVDTFENFQFALAAGDINLDAPFDNLKLNTGDQVIVKEEGIPTFWFEKGADVESDLYWYIDSNYPLGVCESMGNNYLGTFHPSNESRIIGDIDTALDAILAIQETLIGGDE